MRLVIQGPALDPHHQHHIAKLCGSAVLVPLGPHACHLRTDNIAQQAAVASYCAQHRLDCAWVPDSQQLKNFGLLVMDMDSTLISIECIDEIADMQGLKPQIAAITAAAMRGEIEFAESLRRRVSLLHGLEESALQRVYDERLALNPGAQHLVNTLRAHGIKTLLVSGGFTFFTERLQKNVGIDFTAANVLEIENGRLTGRLLGNVLDAQGKADWLVRIRKQLGLRQDQVVCMGDGANDLQMMAAAGISIAYHAKPVVREQATYALNHSGLDGMLNLFTPAV